MTNIPLLSEIDQELAKKLIENSQKVEYPAEKNIFTEGETPNGKAYIIIKGKVAVVLNSSEIKELGEGEIIGEMALLSSEPRTATVTSLEDVLLLELSEESIMRILGDEGSNLSKIIVKRVEENSK